MDGLADQGKLNHYLKHSSEEKGKQKVGQSNSGDTEGFIGVITGGFASGGLTLVEKSRRGTLKMACRVALFDSGHFHSSRSLFK